MKNILLRIYNNHFGIIIIIASLSLFYLICAGFNGYTDNHRYVSYAIDIYQNGFVKAENHWELRSFIILLYLLSFLLFGLSEFSVLLPAALFYSFIIFFSYKILEKNNYAQAKIFAIILLSLPPFMLFFMVDYNFTELAILFNLLAISYLLNQRSERKIIYFLTGIFVGFAYLTYSQLSLLIIFFFVYFYYKKNLRSFYFIALGAFAIFMLEMIYLLILYQEPLIRLVYVSAHKSDSFFRSLLPELTKDLEYFITDHQKLLPRHIFYVALLLVVLLEIKKSVIFLKKYFLHFSLITIFICSIYIINILVGNIYLYWRYFASLFVLLYIAFAYLLVDYIKNKRYIYLIAIYIFAFLSIIYSYGDHFWLRKSMLSYAMENKEKIYTNMEVESIHAYIDMKGYIDKEDLKANIVQELPNNQRSYYFRGADLFDDYLAKNKFSFSHIENCAGAIKYHQAKKMNFFKRIIKQDNGNMDGQIDVANDLVIFDLAKIYKCKIERLRSDNRL